VDPTGEAADSGQAPQTTSKPVHGSDPPSRVTTISSSAPGSSAIPPGVIPTASGRDSAAARRASAETASKRLTSSVFSDVRPDRRAVAEVARSRGANSTGRRLDPSLPVTALGPRGRREGGWLAGGLRVGLVGLIVMAVVLAWLGTRQAVRNRLLMIGGRGPDAVASEDPGRSGVAVRERLAPHRTCGGVRRPFGHLRSLPPASRERRAHGQRHGRTRNTGHGRSGRRGRVPA
jgi:hypothetical protein